MYRKIFISDTIGYLNIVPSYIKIHDRISHNVAPPHKIGICGEIYSILKYKAISQIMSRLRYDT